MNVYNGLQHTTSVGKCDDELECKIWDARRRMEPIGTGLANEIPSSDKKRMGDRVKRAAFENPS
jgi:hypothetical protein